MDRHYPDADVISYVVPDGQYDFTFDESWEVLKPEAPHLSAEVEADSAAAVSAIDRALDQVTLPY